MKTVAVYAGTFDPITLGHMDVIERAAKLFDQIIIGVALSPSKKPLFSLDERVALIKETFTQILSVSVYGFDGLLLSFVQQHQANIILRGLRAVADFDYEFQLASMNRFMNPNIESVFLMPAEKYMYISSSLVREIALLGGEVAGFVPPHVVEALDQKFKMKQ